MSPAEVGTLLKYPMFTGYLLASCCGARRLRAQLERLQEHQSALQRVVQQEDKRMAAYVGLVAQHQDTCKEATDSIQRNLDSVRCMPALLANAVALFCTQAELHPRHDRQGDWSAVKHK